MNIQIFIEHVRRAIAYARNPRAFIRRETMVPIRCRKAANLSPGEALGLLELAQRPEVVAVLAMQVPDTPRDLQCLLDIQTEARDAGFGDVAEWWRREKLKPKGALYAVWKADQAQRKRSL